MKRVANFTHPRGWQLFAILPGESSPMEDHKPGEVAADDKDKRFLVHEIFLVHQGLASIESACANYPTTAPILPA